MLCIDEGLWVLLFIHGRLSNNYNSLQQTCGFQHEHDSYKIRPSESLVSMKVLGKDNKPLTVYNLWNALFCDINLQICLLLRWLLIHIIDTRESFDLACSRFGI